jgi:hypothetical protein
MAEMMMLVSLGASLLRYLYGTAAFDGGCYSATHHWLIHRETPAA